MLLENVTKNIPRYFVSEENKENQQGSNVNSSKEEKQQIFKIYSILMVKINRV